jgi:hypothetical protein
MRSLPLVVWFWSDRDADQAVEIDAILHRRMMACKLCFPTVVEIL